MAFSRRGQDIQGVASLVAHWLRKCQENHALCVQAPTLEWPCRLTDLDGYDPAP